MAIQPDPVELRGRKTLSIILPTITGREEMRAWIIDCFNARTPIEIQWIVRVDYPNWPSGVNAGMPEAEGDYLFFAADDLEPLDGWCAAMIACLDGGAIPAPQVWDYVQQGAPVNEGADGPPGTVTAFSRAPAFTREVAKAIGPWPEIDYYADNWVSDKARTLGIPTVVTAGYSFIHHWNQVGRLDHGDWQGRSEPLYHAELAKL